MVKYFLKNSDQEVKIGNTIIISVPGKTPYGEGKCEVKVLVTHESLQQLVKDGLVQARNVLIVKKDDYKPFVRMLARRMKLSFDDTLEVLDSMLDASVYAHNCLLVDLMASCYNDGKKPNGKVYIINMYTWTIYAVSPDTHHGPVFYDIKDAQRALKLLKPFLAYVNA